MVKVMNKKENKLIKKIQRLKRYDGVDMCACNSLECSGPCRSAHTTDNGDVRCVALYQINVGILERELERMQIKTQRDRKSDKEVNREKFSKGNKRPIFKD